MKVICFGTIFIAMNNFVHFVGNLQFYKCYVILKKKEGIFFFFFFLKIFIEKNSAIKRVIFQILQSNKTLI